MDEGVAEVPQGDEEGEAVVEEREVVGEGDLEEGRRSWLSHTDMKVFISPL